MSFWSETKRFFREVNKKLVDKSPISSIPPFDKVKKANNDPRNHIGANSIDEKEKPDGKSL